MDPQVALKTAELAQALEAHLIVILVENAMGALAEAEDFCTHPAIAPTTLVLAPVDYKDGYSAHGSF